MTARPRRTAFLLIVIVPAWLAGTCACRKPPAPPSLRYPVKGRVVEVALPEKQLMLEHEDIPGYMPAMTMPFPVKDEALLKVAAVGDEVTASLVIQDGKKVRLADYRGRALALTFIYTRCPLPDFCPLMMQNFVAVEAALAAEPALHARTGLLSISFDTAHDTPEVLKRYGRSLAGEGPHPF